MHRSILCADTLPHPLGDLASPPESLYLWGRLPPRPYVALVGSRRVTREGLRHARRLAKELGKAGVTVISGGAAGVDAAAHEGALDARAPTLVVAPCAFEKPYPSGHAGLFRRVVAEGGGYVSLLGEPQGPRPEHFHRRNAVLAALCDVLVMGEANERSGSRNAAMHARRLGRAVFAVPSAAWNELGRGSNQELRAGARWLEDSGDVLRYLQEVGQYVATSGQLAGAQPSRAVSPKPSKRSGRRSATKAGATARQLGFGDISSGAPSAVTRAVERALRAGKRHVDAICEHTALDAGDVNAALLELTLRGDAGEDADGLLRWCGGERS